MACQENVSKSKEKDNTAKCFFAKLAAVTYWKGTQSQVFFCEFYDIFLIN